MRHTSAPTLYHYMPSSCCFTRLPSPLVDLSWVPPPSCCRHSAPLLLLWPLKETWSLKSAKCSILGALKRVSVQVIITKTATESHGSVGWAWLQKEGSLAGRAEAHQVLTRVEIIVFFCYGALLHHGGSWNETPHMVFAWSGQHDWIGNSGLMHKCWKCSRGGCNTKKGSKKAAAVRAKHWNVLCCFHAERFTWPIKLWLWSNHIVVLHSQYLQKISKSKHALIKEQFKSTVRKFQRWAKLETQLWLSGPVRFIKIYETANMNPWCLDVLSTFVLSVWQLIFLNL